MWMILRMVAQRMALPLLPLALGARSLVGRNKPVQAQRRMGVSGNTGCAYKAIQNMGTIRKWVE
ncbi:hypothetical protein ANRL3_02231 [Anaerolineae bacterium]|nr:hypothetical protein ANRL3_02231 [Anaerolineae bacterium]